MPPIIILAAGAFAAGAIVHRLIKEVRRINSELDRVKTGRAIDPVRQGGGSQKYRALRTAVRHRWRLARLPVPCSASAPRAAPPQYSSASMIVITRSVTFGSAGSGECSERSRSK